MEVHRIQHRKVQGSVDSLERRKRMKTKHTRRQRDKDGHNRKALSTRGVNAENTDENTDPPPKMTCKHGTNKETEQEEPAPLSCSKNREAVESRNSEKGGNSQHHARLREPIQVQPCARATDVGSTAMPSAVEGVGETSQCCGALEGEPRASDSFSTL